MYSLWLKECLMETNTSFTVLPVYVTRRIQKNIRELQLLIPVDTKKSIRLLFFNSTLFILGLKNNFYTIGPDCIL